MAAKKSMRRLVIVESPTKARTISRFLPDDYRVEASMGHVRDLPSSASEIPEKLRGESWATLGVNVDAGFQPLYVVSPGKRDVVKKLKAAVKDADELYIATDEDREGESIGWHLVELLEPKVPVKRMVFHEITERAIRDALEQTRDIDGRLVDAQETRRVLDRLVGYSISPLLWRKIAPRLSAGRVQSVAVRLLVMRERERLEFVKASYWDLTARLDKAGKAFDAALTHVGDVRVAQGRDFDPDTGRLRTGLEIGKDVVTLDESAAAALVEPARAGRWSVTQVEERETSRSPAPPFTTSTLQQESSRKLGLAAKDTMRVAQSLYENGYITYMRTDSISLSSEALQAAKDAIVSRYGAEYLADGDRRFRRSAAKTQEAHEAIRPAGTQMKTAAEHGLKGVEASLYDLIWKRTVASQMRDARINTVTARIAASVPEQAVAAAGVQAGGSSLTFRASGRTVVFPGFFRAYVEGSDDPEAALDDKDQPLPALAKDDALALEALNAVGHETKPPARYTDASLVKLLESEGIGRPSTYASIIDTILARRYAVKSGQQLVPTFTAFATTNLLEQQFRRLVDTEFTAQMESALDDIASGDLASTGYLRDFYLGDQGIDARVKAALDEVDARGISTIESVAWDPYRVRVGRYGPYAEGEVDGQTLTASLPGDAAPADISREDLERFLREGNMGDVEVAREPASDEAIYLKRGPFGPYLQLGAGDGDAKPKRVSLPPGVAPHDLTPELAVDLMALPRRLGEHPESGDAVEVGIGRFGPYVRHQRTYASIPKDQFLLEVTLERALELIANKSGRAGPLRTLGEDPATGEVVEIRDGRYGPYAKRGKVNASLPKDVTPDEITLEHAVELLNARAAAPSAGGRRGKAGRGTKAAAGTRAKGAAGKKASAKKPAAKKATTKKAVAKKTTAKSASASQPPAKATGAKKPAAKRAAARRTTTAAAADD